MAHSDPLNVEAEFNDPDLNRLVRQLGRVSLSPSPQQRQRLLYACGVAVGRAQMKRRVRAATAVAVALAGVSVGLGALLIKQDASKTIALNPALAPPAARPASNGSAKLVRRDDDEPSRVDGSRLTAATTFQELLAMDRARATETPGSRGPTPAPKRILTAADHSAIEDL